MAKLKLFDSEGTQGSGKGDPERAWQSVTRGEVEDVTLLMELVRHWASRAARREGQIQERPLVVQVRGTLTLLRPHLPR